MKRCMLVLSVVYTVLLFTSCKASKTEEEKSPTVKAEESINNWMGTKTTDYPAYKSVSFGDLTPRYQKSNRTYQLHTLIEIEKSKQNPNQNTLDSLENLLNSNRGEFLGYTIVHKYQTESVAGEIIENENLFFLDSLFRIITILNADAYDQIMDEKLIFRQEEADTSKKE